jgi:type I restriction enzyme M protein
MKSNGKAACILPHGVLFRGNAEGVIREKLVRSGILKGIIGLPANLFYGTGIPACILVLDKENALARKGIFMIDAAKGFIKDGSKNRLREQDLHKIVDAFTKFIEIPGYSRMVPLSEIADAKNDFNLNLPRYIDSSDPEDIQDIDAHLNGGIPKRDIDALGNYWDVLPAVRNALFESAGRPGCVQLKLPISDIKHAILSHLEFAAFNESALSTFEGWKHANVPLLKNFGKNGHPKQLIEALSEDLLAKFKPVPLINAYDVYQHLMEYWAEVMQDDCYLIADLGWQSGSQPREVVKVKGENGKLTWPKEAFDYEKGKRRFKSDLLPSELLITNFFDTESKFIDSLETELLVVEQKIEEMMDVNSGDDGLLVEVIEAEGDKKKIAAKVVKARIKEISKDPDYADELKVLQEYAGWLDKQTSLKSDLKVAQDDLTEKLAAKYPKLTEDEVKNLVIHSKWIKSLTATVQGELHRVSQTLTGRIRQLAGRYEEPLHQIDKELLILSSNVNEHLKKMGFTW